MTLVSYFHSSLLSPSIHRCSLLAHCDDDEHIVEKVSEVDEVGNNAANSYRKKSLTDECCSTTMRVATIGGGVGGGGDGGDDHKEAAAATLSMPNNTTTVAAPCSGSNVRQSIVTVPSSTASPAPLSSALASPITSSPRSSLNNAEIVETSNSLVSIPLWAMMDCLTHFGLSSIAFTFSFSLSLFLLRIPPRVDPNL